MEIYLDNSATTRISDEALDAYIAASREHFGNPSSLHGRGQDAESVLKAARDKIRKTLGDTLGGTLIFTSGGTEANNLAIVGRAHAKERYRGKKILTTAGEHASVNLPLSELEKEGFRVVEIPTVGGRIDPAVFARECTPDTILVSMMLVNNETGALYDLPALSRIMKRQAPDAILHVDATQAYLKIPFTVKTLGCQMITVSSHKIEGPKGMGALWVDPGVVRNKGLAPLLIGGGQEGGFRSGTENLPGAAAFGVAAELGFAHLTEHYETLSALASRLIERIQTDPALAGVSVNRAESSVPHIVSLTAQNIKSETLLHALSARGIYVSSGSACSSHGKHGTSALTAFGLSDRDADCTVRVSFSYRNTFEDVDALCAGLAEELPRLARIR